MKTEILSNNCTIILGDNADILPTLKNKFDAIISDPPYGINYVYDKDYDGGLVARNRKPIYGDAQPFDPQLLLDAMGAFRNDVRSFTKPLAIMGANHFSQYIPANTGTWLCWDKSVGQGPAANFVDAEFAWTNRITKRNIFHLFWCGRGRSGQGAPIKHTRKHPSQKPVELMAWLMSQCRVGLGRVVLDPYMGSGSTGVACLQTGRKFIGIEIDEEYFEIAKARLQAEIDQQKDQLNFMAE